MDTKTASTQKPLKTLMNKQRRRIYMASIFFVATVVYLFISIFNIASLHAADSVFSVILTVICGCLASVVYRNFRRTETAAAEETYTGEDYEYLRRTADQYTKRRLNGIALLCMVISLFILSGVNLYFSGNSKFSELLESIFSSLILLEIPFYLCVKNHLCSRLFRERLHSPDKPVFRKHLLGVSIFSATYWTLTLALTILFSQSIHYPFNVYIGSGIVFWILILVYNVTFRKKITYRNITVNQRRAAVFASAFVLASAIPLLQQEHWYVQPYINSVPIIKHGADNIDYNETTGTYTITAPEGDFKILQLTDIHLGGSFYSYSKDIKALKACYAELAYTKPDLVIVTGDLCFPLGIMSMSLNNSAPVNQFAAFMRNTGIPWAFTYGNHDTESLASTSKKDLNEIYKSLSYKTSANLLYPYVHPEISGRNNQLIEVRNPDGTLNTALFLIDSNAYTGEGINVYDYIHDDQVDWYEGEVRRLNAEEGHTVSSMAFFHIPLQQYRTAYNLYAEGSDEVTYFFGENGESMVDKVCCSTYPSSLFDRMLELGSTKAVFCGHDHYNNMSLEYKGIRLTYGMSIDYLAMPGIEDDTKQRGATLITLHPDSSWDLEQIPLTAVTD